MRSYTAKVLQPSVEVYDTVPVHAGYQQVDAVSLPVERGARRSGGVALALYGHWLLCLSRGSLWDQRTGPPAIRFVDVSPQRIGIGQKTSANDEDDEKDDRFRRRFPGDGGAGDAGDAGGLAVAPVSYPPDRHAAAVPDVFTDPEDMAVCGHRLWVADGRALRCFALALNEEGAGVGVGSVPRVSPLSVTELDFEPVCVYALDCAAAGVRLFMSFAADEKWRTVACTDSCLLSGINGGSSSSTADSKSVGPATGVRTGTGSDWQDVGAVEIVASARGRLLVIDGDMTDARVRVRVLDAATGQQTSSFPLTEANAEDPPAPAMVVIGDALVMGTPQHLIIRNDCGDF
jgi:hypothetical protein